MMPVMDDWKIFDLSENFSENALEEGEAKDRRDRTTLRIKNTYELECDATFFLRPDLNVEIDSTTRLPL